MLLSLTAAASARDMWPEVQSPPKSKMALITADTKLNGVPMRVWGFEASVGAAEVLSFYRAQWGSSAENKSIENVMGKWQVIGRRDGAYYTTVQVEPVSATRSKGYLSVSMLPSYSKVGRGPQFPMMAGSKLVSDQESRDPGRKARTLVMTNQYSVDANLVFYRDRLISQGWQMDVNFKKTVSTRDGNSFFFKRRNEEAIVAVAPQARHVGSAVVASVVTLEERL